MAFTRPTLSELVDRVQQDFISRLELVTPILRRSMVYVLARVVAGAAHLLHGFLEFLSRQIFPDLAEHAYLVRFGSLFGVALNPATFATGPVTCTGVDGTVIEAGTVLIHADGAEYRTDAEATIASGTATVSVTAASAGEIGNKLAGVVLSFQSPIAGIDATATVATGGIANGSDEEETEDFRARVLERMQSPPHGGNEADYVAWAKKVAGVTRAWCYPLESGAGTVKVRFVRDDDASLIPDSGEVAAVQALIDTKRPAGAVVTVAAPVADSLAMTIHLVPSTVATKAAVTAELTDLIRRDSSPGGTLLLSKIRNAIGDADGVLDYTLTAPSADVTHATGHIPVLGTITWS